MADAITQLKTKARMLHRRVQAGDAEATKRLRILPEFRSGAPHAVQRKHCLAVVGREFGFEGWQHASRVLRGDPDETDLGTSLYPSQCSGFVNSWFADYGEAQRTRARVGGYLLGYRRQFVVVQRTFIEALGLDPDDPDWAEIGWDWARPKQRDARGRLYTALVAARDPA